MRLTRDTRPDREPMIMDAIDRKILTALQADATISIGELADKVGLSQTPCWKRVQRLEQQGVILRRVAIVAPEKIGLTLTVFVEVQIPDHSVHWLDRFARAITAMPEVLEFYRMAGDVDYLLRVVVSDISDYDRFYKKLIDDFQLKSVTSRFAMERIKSTTAYRVPEEKI